MAAKSLAVPRRLKPKCPRGGGGVALQARLLGFRGLPLFLLPCFLSENYLCIHRLERGSVVAFQEFFGLCFLGVLP